MKYYFAPMEGITLAPLRVAHGMFFPGIDKYFSPFLVANQTLHFHQSEIRDILPENNHGITLVPQVLTNKANQMLWAMDKLSAYGYREMNLNLGCPMPTVAKRGRGAGFLADPEELDRFFDEVFEGLKDRELCLSVKTRIGLDDPALSEELMKVYNRYPIHELIIHPRLLSDRYQGSPRLDVFGAMLAESVHPVCYNGDIRTERDLVGILNRFPEVDRVMVGRGLLMNPSFVRDLKEGKENVDGLYVRDLRDEEDTDSGKSLEKTDLVFGNHSCRNYKIVPESTKSESGTLLQEEIAAYHDAVFQSYLELLPDGRQAVAKMKDIWSFWKNSFPGKEKELKKLRKAVWPEQYQACVETIL